ncbi:uncharacterized protein [Diadema antillarum]|uniref:uncharacterized protein n=1 Tax=Diadema antillarum TaxID=105358 RepID=UPI003A8516A6
MATKVFIALMALLVVAMAFEFDPTDEEVAADVEFMKRDPVMQDFWLAEKRGQSMRKYKACESAPGCWCMRRGGKVAYCGGAGGGAI